MLAWLKEKLLGHVHSVKVTREGGAEGLVSGPYKSHKEARAHLDRLASQDHPSSKYSIHTHKRS